MTIFLKDNDYFHKHLNLKYSNMLFKESIFF